MMQPANTGENLVESELIYQERRSRVSKKNDTKPVLLP